MDSAAGPPEGRGRAPDRAGQEGQRGRGVSLNGGWEGGSVRGVPQPCFSPGRVGLRLPAACGGARRGGAQGGPCRGVSAGGQLPVLSAYLQTGVLNSPLLLSRQKSRLNPI